MSLAVPAGVPPVETKVPTVMLALLAPPAPPAMVTEPVLTPVNHWRFPTVRPFPTRMVTALIVLAPLPRYRSAPPEPMLAGVPVVPGVGMLLSPTLTVPAVIELL